MPVPIKLDEDERTRLSALATARKRSSHYLMREAVREYLTREELRQGFADEAEKAWIDYEKTGRHVTLDEVDAWVRSLDTLDLQRLHRLLAEKNPDAAQRAMRTIRDKLREQFPRLGAGRS